MSQPRSDLIDVECPCCEAKLRIDPATQAVISHVEKERPRVVEDLTAAVHKLKGESARRDQLFDKQVAEQKTHQQVLDRKFEELLQQAKDAPDLTPPTKDIDLD
jgi:hypothetical protein